MLTAAANLDCRATRVTGLRRWLYVCLGLFFVGLAVLGAILPILPTTPFLLLASWFFVRSSPRLRAWMLGFPLFGQLLQNWEKHRTVSRRAKRTAYVMIAGSVSASAAFGGLGSSLILLLGGGGAIGLFVVWRLPVEVPSVDVSAGGPAQQIAAGLAQQL